MELTIFLRGLMTSPVQGVFTWLSFNAPTLHTLIVDVLTLTLMMLLCTAVSINIYLMYHICIDSTRIWNNNPYSGMIRLQGGNYSNEGRVEVYCNGQWGTICNNRFGSIDAQTICKQLGYNYCHNYNHLNL